MLRLFLIAISSLGATTISCAESPHWIWDQERSTQQVVMHKTLDLDAAVVSARIAMATMSCRAKLFIDDDLVSVLEPYDPLFDQTLTIRLDRGRHDVRILASGIDGPSAVFARLELEIEDGSSQTFATNDDWRSSRGLDGGPNAIKPSPDSPLAPVADLGPINPKLLVDKDRLVQIDAVDNYEQWKQALGGAKEPDPAAFVVSPGFEIQLVRSAKPTEDSWVSMEFREDGRLIIAKEKAGLLLMDLSEQGDAVTHVEAFAETLQECRGLAVHNGHLFANANNSKALYKIERSGNGYGEPIELLATRGGVGHGRNDLVVGPDGFLYSIHGDAVDLPTGPEITDLTSPFREARRGTSTREGHLLRIDPRMGTQTDSQTDFAYENTQVFVAGLRNPFGIDVNRHGELFTYDADAEFDMGAPWYRATRVNHLVVGGDYGWRGVTGNWPPYYPDHADNARHSLDIGKGSPTAVKFGTRSHFPGRFREALFVLDWAYGRIVAVHMVPRGASYLMVAETFLKGRPLNVTDLAFSPDGSMYLVTGGRQTQSSLYRVRWTGDHPTSTDPRDSVADESSKSDFANEYRAHAERARGLRRMLEAQLAEPPSNDQAALAWVHLDSQDPWISYAARNVLERQPLTSWAEKALTIRSSRAAAQSLLSLARSGESSWLPKVVQRLNQRFPLTTDPNDRAALLEAYRLCFEERTIVGDQLRRAAAETLNAAYPASLDSGRFQAHNWMLSELLVELEHPEAVSKSIELLNRAIGQRDQMHYLYVLRNAKVGWTLTDRESYFAGLRQANQYLVGAGMSGFLEKIREEAIGTLSDDERETLGSETLDATPPTVVDSPTSQRAFVRRWKIEDFESETATEGSAQRGAKIFAAATCSNCHRYGSQGTLVGPDLTSAAGRFSGRDFLQSILNPSQVIAQNYRSIQVVTTDGRVLTGLTPMIGDYRSPKLRLATNPASPLDTIEIPKSDIESQQASRVSWMPTGLLDHFTREEIEDLLAYLRSQP